MLCFEGNNALNLISARGRESTALPRPPSCLWGGESNGKGRDVDRKGEGKGDEGVSETEKGMKEREGP